MSTIDQTCNPNETLSSLDTSASKATDSAAAVDFNLTKKFLTGHRGELTTSHPTAVVDFRLDYVEDFSSGTSALSQAVHAALANVIQDPLITATGDSTLTPLASGDASIHLNNRCENCSKLRQQLTLLIYEVLNLENTMESKICEYVQRRLSEIAVSEQFAKGHATKEPNDSTNAADSIFRPFSRFQIYRRRTVISPWHRTTIISSRIVRSRWKRTTPSNTERNER